MFNCEKIKRYDLERGGIRLSYLDDNNLTYSISIYVDVIHCVYILISGLWDNYMCFNLIHNYGYTAKECLDYIKNSLDTSKLPHDSSKKIYEELLDNPEIHNCLDNCIKKIPDVLTVEEEKQIAIAREEYEKAVNAALMRYELSIREIVSTARNVEQFIPLSSKENFGIIEETSLNNHKL